MTCQNYTVAPQSLLDKLLGVERLISPGTGPTFIIPATVYATDIAAMINFATGMIPQQQQDALPSIASAQIYLDIYSANDGYLGSFDTPTNTGVFASGTMFGIPDVRDATIKLNFGNINGYLGSVGESPGNIGTNIDPGQSGVFSKQLRQYFRTKYCTRCMEIMRGICRAGLKYRLVRLKYYQSMNIMLKV